MGGFDGAALGFAERGRVGTVVGAELLGCSVGAWLGRSDGSSVGVLVVGTSEQGLPVPTLHAVDDLEGASVGDSVGDPDGSRLGPKVGTSLSCSLGTAVGETLGDSDGSSVGVSEPTADGANDGCRVL